MKQAPIIVLTLLLTACITTSLYSQSITDYIAEMNNSPDVDEVFSLTIDSVWRDVKVS